MLAEKPKRGRQSRTRFWLAVALSRRCISFMARVRLMISVTQVACIPGASPTLLQRRRSSAAWERWIIVRHLILKRILLPVSLRQQEPPGRGRAFLSSHGNLCCVGTGILLRTVAIGFNICSKLVKNTVFFGTLEWFFFISKLSQTHFDGQWHCNDARPTCICLTRKRFFRPLLSHHENWSWRFS